MNGLNLSHYDYELPQSLIAKKPCHPREDAKLLVYCKKTKTLTHSDFWHFCDFLPHDTLLIFNNTKVLPARIFGHKMHKGKQGAQIQALFHRSLEDGFLFQCKGRLKEDSIIQFAQGIWARVLELREDGLRLLRLYDAKNHILSQEDLYEFLSVHGVMPLPPYLKRPSTHDDFQDYQSVFASQNGAIASPTASLHFGEQSFLALKEQFMTAMITLHIGFGTFKQVESEEIIKHKMHAESYSINQDSQERIKSAKHITAIGTSAMRCVEYFARSKNACGECDLFLHPLNPPSFVQGLLTNFHLPKTTLLMLVASMVGVLEMQRIYKEAIQKQYRFYSYGDGMLII